MATTYEPADKAEAIADPTRDATWEDATRPDVSPEALSRIRGSVEVAARRGPGSDLFARVGEWGVSDDHRALIERAREAVEACQPHMRARDHLQINTLLGHREAVYADLADDVPGLASLVARLAAALEQKATELAIQGGIAAGIFRDLVKRDAELSSALARLAAAERERDDWKRIVDQNLTACEETCGAVRRELAAEAALHDLTRAERDAARLALQQIRELLDLELPSEQTGPEWEQCARVPILFLRTIDDVLRGVLGEPATTNEPKPALHPAALTAPQEAGQSEV